jgi:hypothetical protein
LSGDRPSRPSTQRPKAASGSCRAAPLEDAPRSPSRRRPPQHCIVAPNSAVQVNPGNKGGGGWGATQSRGVGQRPHRQSHTNRAQPSHSLAGSHECGSRWGGACLRRELAVRLKSMSSRRLSRIRVGPRYAAWQSVRAMQPKNDAHRVVGLGREQQLTH